LCSISGGGAGLVDGKRDDGGHGRAPVAADRDKDANQDRECQGRPTADQMAAH
jgi:hypothetical protein